MKHLQEPAIAKALRQLFLGERYLEETEPEDRAVKPRNALKGLAVSSSEAGATTIDSQQLRRLSRQGKM